MKIEYELLYACDHEKNTECPKKSDCSLKCTSTTDVKFARLDDKDEPIITAIMHNGRYFANQQKYSTINYKGIFEKQITLLAEWNEKKGIPNDSIDEVRQNIELLSKLMEIRHRYF